MFEFGFDQIMALLEERYPTLGVRCEIEQTESSAGACDGGQACGRETVDECPKCGMFVCDQHKANHGCVEYDA